MTRWRPSVTRPLLTALALTLLASGCAHTIEVQSEPPGAQVLVEDEPVCVTPCAIEEQSGSNGVTRVEVQSEETGEAVRFDLLREGWTYWPVAAGVGLGALAIAISVATGAAAVVTYTATSFFLVAGGVLILPTVGAAGLGLLLVGTGYGTALVAYTVSITLASLGPRLPLAMAGEASRISDDEVFVDFEEDEVYASPGDNVRRLIGASPGYKPLPAWRPHEGEDEDDDAPPPAADRQTGKAPELSPAPDARDEDDPP